MIKLIRILLLLLLPYAAFAQPASRYEVIITEIMADPEPSAGLSVAEYVEIKNKSGRTLNLKDWRLTTSTSRSGHFTDYSLPADSIVILASSAQAPLLESFGAVLAVPSFPALINGGTVLSLVSDENKIIHAVPYSKDWYGNEVKAQGGWSLEMIDTDNPCTASSNWTASTATNGGTPGQTNAVNGTNKDETPPALVSAHVLDDTTIIVTFDEPIDSTSSVVLNHYHFNPSLTITAATALNPLLNSVQLQLATSLNTHIVYTLTVQNVTDCSGNSMGTKNKINMGQPQQAAIGDIIINEILFDPKPNGYDYIELYNRSNKVVDAGQLYIANRNSAGGIASLKKLSETPYYLFPGDYVVLTEDAASLSLQYFVQNPNAVLVLPALPSLPDHEGKVALLNGQGDVIDELHYSKDWHFQLIRDAEGVALERLDMERPTQDKSNWHSAASAAGFGTPGYKNSQYQQEVNSIATIEVQPKTFSPDGDGYDDIAMLHYQVTENGYAANVFIFDAMGRQVRHLVQNDLLATKGQWKWDGLNEKGQRLPIGTYLIYTEVFNLQGKKQSFKNPIVLTRKIN